MKRLHQGISIMLGVVLIAGMIGPAPAAAWQTGSPDLWDTHDWVTYEAAELCSQWDSRWLDPDIAIDACQYPDAGAVPQFTCSPSEPGHADAEAQALALFDDAVEAYAAGDMDRASDLAGTMAHLVADLGDPAYVAEWGATSDRTVRWRGYVQSYTNKALFNHGWICSEPMRYVDDPAKAIAALSARTKAVAPRAATLTDNAATSRWVLEARQLLAARLVDSTRLVAGLYATIEARAQREIVAHERYAGSDRYGTACAVAEAAYTEGADTVLVASGAAWPDALAGSSLAGVLDAPMLLSKWGAVPSPTIATIKHLGASKVIVLGGTAALSDAVVRQLDALPGVSVERIAGIDRYATARALARRARAVVGSTPREAFVVTGRNYVDALSVSQLAARRGSPVVLGAGASSAASVVTSVRDTGAGRVYIVGGTAAVSTAIEDALVRSFGRTAVIRIAGSDRYATAVEVLDLAEEITGTPVEGIFLASGKVFADGIVGGPAAARSDSGLLLSRSVRLDSLAANALASRRDEIENVSVLGGTAVLSGFIEADMQRALDATPVVPPEYETFDPMVAMQYSYCADDSGPVLGHYYTDRAPTYLANQKLPKDANGIVMVKYADFTSPVYNPVTVAQYAIGAYDRYLETGDATVRADFLKHADWLCESSMDSRGRFPYKWPYAPRALTPPWYSGMAQGLGISALLRAYQLTGHESYLTCAKKAFEPFKYTVAEGGVVTVTSEDLWLEEYAEARPKQVLNGSIFAMWGIWDLYRVTGSATAKAKFDRATETLKAHLGDYESAGYVLYERCPGHYANAYFDLHVRQLRSLTGITGDIAFANRGDRWSLIPPNPTVDPSTMSLGVGDAGIELDDSLLDPSITQF